MKELYYIYVTYEKTNIWKWRMIINTCWQKIIIEWVCYKVNKYIHIITCIRTYMVITGIDSVFFFQEISKLENTVSFLRKRMEEAETIEWRGMFVKNPLWWCDSHNIFVRRGRPQVVSNTGRTYQEKELMELTVRIFPLKNNGQKE